MTEQPERPVKPGKPQPAIKAKAQAELEARRGREAAALRANLRKRKQQVRDRTVKAPEDQEDGAIP
ncbi:hypothetical protein [Brytella acorum]|uniref:Uncharacterized protein n=1 Tax=Brytella acorum TaxID=2959299 RepID=A0AA35XWI2_9PROT|nr:hypothetical protein [Brytella acorum]MDF3624012.1 hypothetical protein [Brytella acorum]CAI9120885.1 hypothetical protein LMG32879_001725 [Brytella acorum]